MFKLGCVANEFLHNDENLMIAAWNEKKNQLNSIKRKASISALSVRTQNKKQCA